MNNMSNTTTRVVLVTCPDRATAQRLAESILGAKHAACINLLPGVKSLFWWNNMIQEEHEVLLLIKTTTVRASGLVEFIRHNHPYEVPECLILPVEGGLKDYLSWVEAEIQ